MNRTACTVLAALATACPSVAKAQAEPVTNAYLDIPITQSRNRNGAIRYGVWVKVGERSVEAMLDTGSTGLRVLPSVYPAALAGVGTDVSFGAGLHMEGIAIKAAVKIGSLSGIADVEVVQTVACVTEHPDCDVSKRPGDSYLIGGDGFPSEGYSAILGIGLPFRGTDLENPLVSLGATQWIVDLPRPYEIAEGHLILNPTAEAMAGFSMLKRSGIADAEGCIEANPLPAKQCGTLLFDTGAPSITVAYPGVEAPSRWEDGTPGILSFRSESTAFRLDFTAGMNGGLLQAGVSPAAKNEPAAFILAGIYPFFTYDILYDPTVRLVGLKRRAAWLTDTEVEAEPKVAAAPDR